MIQFELILVYDVNKGTISFFACGYSYFSEPFVEKTALSPMNGPGTLVKNHLIMDARAYFRALYSIPLVYMSVFMPVPGCFNYFNYYSFVESFEIKTQKFSSLVLFQDSFRYSDSFEITHKFYGKFFFFCKSFIGVLKEMVLKSIDQLGNTDILTILSLPVHQQGMFPVICKIFNFFQQCLVIFTVRVFRFLN